MPCALPGVPLRPDAAARPARRVAPPLIFGGSRAGAYDRCLACTPRSPGRLRPATRRREGSDGMSWIEDSSPPSAGARLSDAARQERRRGFPDRHLGDRSTFRARRAKGSPRPMRPADPRRATDVHGATRAAADWCRRPLSPTSPNGNPLRSTEPGTNPSADSTGPPMSSPTSSPTGSDRASSAGRGCVAAAPLAS